MEREDCSIVSRHENITLKMITSASRKGETNATTCSRTVDFLNTLHQKAEGKMRDKLSKDERDEQKEDHGGWNLKIVTDNTYLIHDRNLWDYFSVEGSNVDHSWWRKDKFDAHLIWKADSRDVRLFFKDISCDCDYKCSWTGDAYAFTSLFLS